MFLDKFSIAISSIDSLSFRKIVFWLDILAIGKFNVDVWVLASKFLIVRFVLTF